MIMSTFRAENYRVLIVDDSVQILYAVKEALEAEGFEVATAVSGEKALKWIEMNGLPHLALLDIRMAGMDGFDLCQKIHEFSDLPIIMLTAVADSDVIVQAIDRCAEDYIVKPFHKGELVARTRRVLRRIGDFAYAMEPTVSVDNDFAINFVACQAILKDKQLSLTAAETKILYILMRSAGKPVSVEFLMHRLWPLETADDSRLRVYIHRLRRKLEVDDSGHQYVQSKRGFGYAFQANV